MCFEPSRWHIDVVVRRSARAQDIGCEEVGFQPRVANPLEAAVSRGNLGGSRLKTRPTSASFHNLEVCYLISSFQNDITFGFLLLYMTRQGLAFRCCSRSVLFDIPTGGLRLESCSDILHTPVLPRPELHLTQWPHDLGAIFAHPLFVV